MYDNMYKNVASYATDSQEGKYFEADLIYECRKIYKNGNLLAAINETMDLEEGTDFFWNRIRTDVTANFSGKDHMIRLPGAYSVSIPYIGEVEVEYGIRTGNSYRMFKMPVLVVGFDMAGQQLSRFHDAVISAIRNNWGKIMDLGESLFWNFDDTHPGFIPVIDPYFQ